VQTLQGETLDRLAEVRFQKGKLRFGGILVGAVLGFLAGLGIGGGIPYYVARLDAEKNEVVVAHRQDVSASSFGIGDYLGEEVDAQEELFVKVRSAGEPKGPVRLEAGRVLCPQGMMAVAPGQSAVFYRGDMLVGSGIIR
jgi:tRNA-specific 2-thiouridylase